MIVGRRIGPTENPNLSSNIPVAYFSESIFDIAPQVWKKSFGVDVGMLFVGFDMGESMPDGGVVSLPSGESGDPTDGDLNPYFSIPKDGKNIFQFKGIISDDTPVDAKAVVDINEFRPMAFRVPMILSGWGYDIDGNPTFDQESDKLDYTKNKTAPLDVRYDPDRNVWVAGGSQPRWIEYNP